MVEMAAAMAILLITAAVLLSLLLGLPWWLQLLGAVAAVAGLSMVSRWLVRETLGTRVVKSPASTFAIDFDYLDGEGAVRRYVVDVVRVREDYFEGVTLEDRMHHVFFLTRVKGPINERPSGKSLPPKTWAAEHRFDAFRNETMAV